MLRTLRPSNRAFGSVPNVPKVFDSDSLPIGFGLLNNAFTNDMVGVFLEAGFLPREFLEMAFSALRSTLLQTLAQRGMPLAVLLNCFAAKGLALAIGGQIDHTKIDSEGPIRGVKSWFRHIEGHSQVEHAVAIEQVGLPFDPISTRFLIATNTERNQHASRERYERNRVQTFEGHDTRIIDDSALWLKGWLDALVPLIRFTGFTDSSMVQSQMTNSA
jgi:hypothetical protein